MLLIYNIIEMALNPITRSYYFINYSINHSLYLRTAQNRFNIIVIPIDLYKVNLIIVLK
jgi:hypothetical protein